jgi:two-component system alkaline phosphatase synthesis response regulator PhoP
MKKRILVVDDEKDIRRSVKTALEADGYAVQEAGDAVEARKVLDKGIPDLIVLDVRMPGEDGFSFHRSIQEEPSWQGIPVIFLTSKSGETDRVLGLRMGADDYVVKPFSVPEFLARVQAVLRRKGSEETSTMSAGRVTLIPEGLSVKVDGQPVKLTIKQFELLKLLIQKKGRALSRSYLMECIWGRDYEQSTRTVDQHIYRLRKSLGTAGEKILSVGTLGYKWDEND